MSRRRQSHPYRPRRSSSDSPPSHESRRVSGRSPFELWLARYSWQNWPQQSWLIAFLVLASWAYLDGKLLVSTALGIAVMGLIYRLQGNDQRLWQGWNYQLTFLLLSGGLTTFSVYVSTGIWLEAEQPWLASGLLLQNLGLVGIISFLAWQMQAVQAKTPGDDLTLLLDQLTFDDPLKRLIAVRQVRDYVLSGKLSGKSGKGDRLTQPLSMSKSHVVDCFRVMLSKESDPLVKEAILESLQAWDSLPTPPKRFKPSQAPVIPLNVRNSQNSPIFVRHSQTDEV
ncbi:MAG: hypothetical protein ACRC2J_11195 [Microcoleaceae cyanobacterium]